VSGILLDDVGAPVSLSGRYSAQGAQVRAGLELWAADTGAKLVLLDDASDPQQARRLHEQLVRRGCRLVLGPYGSDSTRAVAHAAQGALVWNHGAAADDVQRLPGVVSVAAPASRYLIALGRTVARLHPGVRVAVARAPGRFAAFAVEGLLQQSGELGIELVEDVGDADAVLACGPVEWEIELFRRIGKGRLAFGGLSPGLAEFPQLLGDDPEGFLAPVQWHPDLPIQPQLGPATIDLDDYVAGQAYAAALIADHCLQLAPADPLKAAKQLQTTTFFGGFKLGRDGVQIGHQLAVIRWHDQRQELQPATRPRTDPREENSRPLRRRRG
jgi:ABC-type branched-subunit amino acid transport system substrate-binding protein